MTDERPDDEPTHSDALTDWAIARFYATTEAERLAADYMLGVRLELERPGRFTIIGGVA